MNHKYWKGLHSPQWKHFIKLKHLYCDNLDSSIELYTWLRKFFSLFIGNKEQALLLEMTYNNKKVTVFVIYRSPSQNNSEFDLSLSYFEKLLSDISKRKPSLSVITDDFNARSSSWWPKDCNQYCKGIEIVFTNFFK